MTAAWNILILVALYDPAHAANLTLAWDPSLSSNVAGYRVYSGPASRVYLNSVAAGNATAMTISNLASGAIYFLSVTALDSLGIESDFSNEIKYTVPVTNPPPTITLTSPANGARYTAPVAINLSAGVGTNGHTITKVQFYNGSTLLGEDSSAPYAFVWNNASAGSYNLSARLVYDAGITATSTVASVTVTNPLPTIALTSPANGTRYATPAVINLAANATANGHAITKVQFYNGSTLLKEDSSAPYVLSWTNASTGTYSVTARLVYDAGSTLTSAAASVTITNPLPTIALTSPASGTRYAAPAVINLAANAIANGHTITKVQFYNGSTLLGEDASAPYALSWTNASAGTYSVTARLVYDAGSTLTSAAASVTITNPLPTIALASPANGTRYAAPAVINLAANATANGHTITKVQFYNGSTLLKEDISAPYALSWTNASAGTYSVTARLVYDAGSTLTSAAASVTITNPLPTIALASPANGTRYAAPAVINLAANATANGHTITKVQFYNGSTLLKEDISAPYALSWTNASAGTYSVTARLVYDAGSTLTSAAASVTITNPLPTIALASPANGTRYAAPAVINLAANATANGHTITKVQFYNGSTLLKEDISAPYALSWTNASAGTYSVTARLVYDASSTLNSTAASVVVTNPLPTITLTAPANGTSYIAPAIINLAANATANGHAISKVQFYNGSALLGEDSSAPYAFTWNSTTTGAYNLSARLVYDTGSTLNSAVSSVTITNPSPTIALTSPANGASYATPAIINLAASATANSHAITKVQFYNGSTLLGEDSSAPYTLTWTNASAGSYNLTARLVYDVNSTLNSAAANITVTSPLPTIALTTPANGTSYIAPAIINLAANATANGHTISKVQFYNGATLLGESSSTPYVFSWKNAGAGSYTLIARMVYDAGDTIGSLPVNVSVANPSPTVTLDSPIDGLSYRAPAAIDLIAAATANGHAITKVQFYNDTTLLGETNSAPYSMTWSNVNTGSYHLSARVIYDAGSAANSALANVVVTNPPLTIALTFPMEGSLYTAPAAISLSANVTTNGHVITKVQFYNGSTLLGENNTEPYALTWSNVEAGNYSLSARAVYDAGNTLDSSPVSVTVSNPPPTITLTSATAGTAPAIFNLGADVTANGHTITEVRFYNDSALLAAASAAPYSFSWDNVSAGSYSLTARLMYDGGSELDSMSVRISVENPSPKVVLAAPVDGSFFVASANIDLTANTVANGHAITKVQFYNDTALLGETNSAPYSMTWSNVNSGSYNLSARVVYDAGITADSIAATVTVTNPPSTITLTSPQDGSFYMAPAIISLAASASAYGHTITNVQFYSGSTLLGESGAELSLTWSNVDAGTYSVNARAIYDDGSALDSAAANITVTNPAPTIVLTAPENGTSYVAPASIDITASPTANGHSITKVQFYNGTTLLGESSSAPFVFQWANATAGSYNLTARLVYDAGEILDSLPLGVSVANPPPNVTLTSPTNGASFSAPATISLSASAIANGHTITKVQFYNGSTLLGETNSVPYNLVWTNVGAGRYPLSARMIYDGGSTLDSSLATITVNGLPVPWQITDVGSLGVSGSAGETNGLYTLNSAGTLDGLTDNFSFANQPFSADGEIKVHLNSMQNLTNSGAVTGVMIRESLTGSSKYVFMGISGATNFLWQQRSVNGAKTSFVRPVAGAPTSPWLRLVRTGATLSGYQSTDGVNWTLVNSVSSFSINLASEIYFGLVASSGSSNQLSTATFTNVTAVP